MRLYEGDFCVIMGLLEKMEGKLCTFGSALSAISRDVHNLQSKSTAGSDQCRGAVNKQLGPMLSLDSWPALPVGKPASSSQLSQTGGPAAVTSRGNPVASSVISSASCTASSLTAGPVTANDVTCTHSAVPSWSAAMSTPHASSNRFAVLASTDDEATGDGEFTLTRSQRRAVTKRQREKSENAVSTNRQSSQPNQQQRQDNKRRIVTGKASGLSFTFQAAKKIEKRSVLCVDNVGLQYDEDDIRNYVNNLGVKVFTCYLAKPRRRPDESPDDVADRKAFRLCVNVDDRDQLLDPRVWPDSVQVSDWFFRSSSNNTQLGSGSDKRQRVLSPDQRDFAAASSLVAAGGGGGNDTSQAQHDGAAAAAAADSVVQPVVIAVDSASTEAMIIDADVVSNANHQVDNNNDETIIYEDGQC